MAILHTINTLKFRGDLVKGLIRLSLVAATCVSAVPASSSWDVVQSNIENGSTNKKFNRYIGEGKNINADESKLDSNVVGVISDDKINNNANISGYKLNLKDADADGASYLFLTAGSYSGIVSNNSLFLENVQNGFDLDVRGAHSYKGEANGNIVTIMASTLDHVIGASTRIGGANNNKVLIKSSKDLKSEVRTIHGGRAFYSKKGASENEVSVDNAKAYYIVGGESQGGKVDANKVFISNNSLSREIIGGKSVTGGIADVSQNEVSISGSTIEAHRESGVYGGLADRGNANLNKVSIQNRSVINSDVYGGKIDERGVYASGPKGAKTDENSVLVDSSTINGDVYGGSSVSGTANFNEVKIANAEALNVYGGKSLVYIANYNKTYILNSNINGDVYGGASGYGFGPGAPEANYNTLTIESSNIKGDVYGGYNENYIGLATNNIINLKNGVKIGGDLVGGKAENDANIRQNELNIYSLASAKNVKNFDTYNFFISKNDRANANLLTLSSNEDTDLKGSKVNLDLQDKVTSLKVGESINLIKKEGKEGKILTDDGIKKSAKVSGIMNDYEFNIDKSDDATIKATLVSKSKNKKGESMLGAFAAPTNMSFKMGDFMSDSVGAIELDLNALEVANLFGTSHLAKYAFADNLGYKSDAYQPAYANDDKNVISFANVNGFKADYDESSIDLKGVALLAGVAFNARENVYGAFIENAYAKFDSDDSDAKIDGKARNYGVGIFSRLNLPSDFYVDLMAKAGRSQTKVDASDLDYKTSAPYYGASVGVGKKMKFDSFMVDSGLNYALSHAGSDEVNVGGSTLKFSSVTSSRAKIYTKLAYDAGKFNPYAKISAEYKFNTKSRITAIQEDEEIALSQKGASVEGELGLRYTPTYATLLNFGIAQSFGKKDQSSVKFQFAYRF